MQVIADLGEHYVERLPSNALSEPSPMTRLTSGSSGRLAFALCRAHACKSWLYAVRINMCEMTGAMAVYGYLRG